MILGAESFVRRRNHEIKGINFANDVFSHKFDDKNFHDLEK